MFLRKLFKVPDKVKWLGLELLVVFAGVYLAFLFQNYSENQLIKKEREKVFVSLKKELEQFRFDFPGNALFQTNKITEWDSLVGLGVVPRYHTWRYLEPQYNFRVIEYAINLQGTDIIDFELYEKLLSLHTGISKIQNAERVMTDFAGRYNNIPRGLSSKDQIAILKAQNLFHYSKFRTGALDRVENLKRVVDEAKVLVKDVNQRLGQVKAQEVEMELLELYSGFLNDDDRVLELFREFFPKYSESFIREKLREFSQK